MAEELVILVDDSNTPIGTAPKATVHTDNTPLHRAFSCFVFRRNGSMLLQQRAGVKVTWPLVWSNACCGHPLPEEDNKNAVQRRLKYEIGLDIPVDQIYEVLPNYRYKAVFQGVMEHEICPVYVVFSDDKPDLNADEVEATKEVDWNEFIGKLLDSEDTTYDHLSIWCREEATLLAQSEMFADLWNKHVE